MRLLITFLIVSAATLGAQATSADGRLLGARHLRATGQLKLFNDAGSVRLIGWDRDSIEVRGRIAPRERFTLVGSDSAIKVGIDDHANGRSSAPCDLVIYLPRRATISVKTVSAGVTGADVSGWIYSVSGAVHLAGASSSLDVLSMSGDVDLNVASPSVHVRTGGGHLLVRGAPQDVDASTIGGRLDVAAAGILRGQFGSVSGDIHYTGAPPAGAILDFSNHGGNIDLALARDVSGRFTLSSVTGPIENGFVQVRPASAGPNAEIVTLGKGAAHVTVRTFKGAIRLRPL